MRKTHTHNGKSLLSLLLAALMTAGTLPLGAAEKRDINDPVLQEILSSFSLRMPRFIDKHGQSVFVADEAVTRSGLMFALYEYDKSLKIPKKDAVGRAEFEELRGKLLSFEKRGSTGLAGAAPVHATGQKIDSTQVINDLIPNMPMILDNSLNDSQVFRSLKNEIATRGAGGAAVDYDAARRDVAALSQRMDNIERSAAAGARGGTAAAPVSYASPEMKASLLQMQRDIEQLNRRLTPVETSRRDLSELEQRMEKMERSYADARVAPAAGSAGATSPEVRAAVNQVQRDVLTLNRQVSALENHEIEYATRSQLSVIEKKIDGAGAEEIALLSRRIDDMQSKVDAGGKSKSSSSAVTRGDIRRIEKRIDDMERTSYADRPASGGGDSTQYASVLTRVTLGLGMVAAFFVAR